MDIAVNPPNPLPQGKEFVNPDGSLTQEAYWFLLTMLTSVLSSVAVNPFIPASGDVADSPVIQAIEKLQAFGSPGSIAVASDALSQIRAIQKALAFSAPTPDVFQRIRVLEILSAFQPIAPVPPVVTEAQIANAEWLTGVAGTNTITGSTTTGYTVLVAGFIVRLIPANTNSAAVTLNVDGIGAQPLTKNGTVALVGGELVAGVAYLLLWDGTEWQILGPVGALSATVLASGASGIPTIAALASGDVWVGSAGNLPVARALSGAFTNDNTGVAKLTGFAYIAVETGANNAIATAVGSGPPLIDGLRLVIRLAHTLRGGGLGNTLDYLTTGSPLPIVSHFDGSTNQATGYGAGGDIDVVYKSGSAVWLDMSQ
jgi:hypothetical protein